MKKTFVTFATTILAAAITFIGCSGIDAESGNETETKSNVIK